MTNIDKLKSINGCHLKRFNAKHKSQYLLSKLSQIKCLFSDSGLAPEPLVLGVISGEESLASLAPGGCVSHTENSLKKITLVNCLIIIILILVIAANINEGKLIKVMVIEYRDISTQKRSDKRAQQDVPICTEYSEMFLLLRITFSYLLSSFHIMCRVVE